MKKSLESYLRVGFLGLVLFALFGFWNYSLGFPVINSIDRALANTAFIMIGTTYIIGPLATRYKWFLGKLYYRKHLGVLGLMVATGHAISEILLYSFSGVLSQFDAYIFGLMALLIFWTLFIITNKRVLKFLGPQTWRRIQSWGYYGILFAMVHVFIRSWKSWSWWIQSPLNLPPTSLVMVLFWFGTFFIRFYFYTFLGGKKHPTEK